LRLKDIRLAYADAETGTRLGAWLTGGVATIVTAAEARDTADAKQRLMVLTSLVPNSSTVPTVWTSHYLGVAYATLGQSDRAVALLDRARPGGSSLWWALRDPLFDALRARGSFGQLAAASEPFSAAPAPSAATSPAAGTPAAPGDSSAVTPAATAPDASG